jgi:hypothetical protein
MTVRDISTLKAYFNNGDVPSESDYIDLLDTIFNMSSNVSISEGPGIDIPIVNEQFIIGLGLDSILVAHHDGSPATEYATITLACAAASSGDIILIARAGTFSESFSIPAGVSLVGLGREKCIVDGAITLGAGSVVANISVIRSANSSGDLSGIVNSSSGTAKVYSTTITITQSGSGGAYGIKITNAGNIELWDCDIRAISVGGPGYGIDKWTNADVTMIGGRLVGSTKQINIGLGITGIASLAYHSGYKCTDIGDYTVTLVSSNNDWAYASWFLDVSGSFISGHTYVTLRCISTSGNPVIAQMDSEQNGVNLTPALCDNTTEGSAMVANQTRELFGNGLRTYRDGYINIKCGWGGPYSFTLQILAIGWEDGNGKHPLWEYGTTVSKPKLYGVDGGNTPDAEPNIGDRSAWDSENYPLLHANDIDTAEGIHHTIGSTETNVSAGNHSHDFPITTLLSELEDVNVTGDTVDGQVLTWDETNEEWIRHSLPEAVVSLSNLQDVDVSDTPEDGQVLLWRDEDEKWVRGTISVTPILTTHYEILQDSEGAILMDENGEILYVEVEN